MIYLLLLAALPQIAVSASYPVVADPQVPVPGLLNATKVELFDWMNFTDFNPHAFSYAMPAAGASPQGWCKIVLVVECRCTEGRQFDRSVMLSIGQSFLFFGTTSEPVSDQGPDWVVTTDVTDFSAMLLSAAANHSGVIELDSTVTPVYTGVISCKSHLDFFPASEPLYPKPRVPHTVVGLGNAQSQLSTEISFPAFVAFSEVYLSLFVQNQHDDEFYWSCLPTNLSGLVGTCGQGSVRFAQVFVDGELAGLAPSFPYIFTGGIDPDLWLPIPGARTLNIVPLRVDLTCFAGILGDGKTHTLNVSMAPVYNDWWVLGGSLFGYIDPQVKATNLVSNTLPAAYRAAETVISSTLVAGRDNSLQGWANVSYSIAGACTATVDRDESPETTVAAAVNMTFFNRQLYNSSGSAVSRESYSSSTVLQHMEFATETAITAAPSAGVPAVKTASTLRFPLKVVQKLFPDPQNQSQTNQFTLVEQAFGSSTESTRGGTPEFAAAVEVAVASQDTVVIDHSSSVRGVNQASTGRFTFADSDGSCWERVVESRNSTVVSTATACEALSWKSRPIFGGSEHRQSRPAAGAVDAPLGKAAPVRSPRKPVEPSQPSRFSRL
eukprot:gene4811-7421_t